MTKMAEVRPRLDAFVDRMRTQLAKKKNQKKTDWRLIDGGGEETLSWLVEQLEKEVQELKSEIYDDHSLTDPKIVKRISSECADVANYAMMISDMVTQDDWC